jgi:hypothetical protein
MPQNGQISAAATNEMLNSRKLLVDIFADIAPPHDVVEGRA